MLIVPDQAMAKCTPLFENTSVRVMSLDSHDHLDAIFDYLLNHQLADDIKYCTQQALGDVILLNSPCEKFSIFSNDAVKTIQDFANYFPKLFNQVCDLNADIYIENNAEQACNLMNKTLNNWLLSFRTTYHKNIIPVLIPTCFEVKLAKETLLESSAQLAYMYKDIGKVTMQALNNAYLNKYNALFGPSKLNLHNILCREYVSFVTEDLLGGILELNPSDMGFPVRKGEYIPQDSTTKQKVSVRSFAKDAIDVNEEIFRAT